MHLKLSGYRRPFPARKFVRKMGEIVDCNEWAPSLWVRALRILKYLGWIGLKLTAMALAVIFIVASLIWQNYKVKASQEDLSSLLDMPERNELFDSTEKFYRALPGPTSRKCVSFQELPEHLVSCLLAVEDTNFFTHSGVNWKSVFAAVVHDLKVRKLERGASTITQQFIKMQRWGTPTGEKWNEKIGRKILEWAIAARLEQKYSKQVIITAYLNRIDFGASLHGIYAVSEGLFGKAPRDLTPVESATIVAMIRSPSLYSPFLENGNALLKRRKNVVLRRMLETGQITSSQVNEWAKSPLEMQYLEWQRNQKNTFASAQAAQELSRLLPKELIEHGGLHIRLTLNPEWDAKCAEELSKHLARLESRHDWKHPRWVQGWMGMSWLASSPHYPFVQGCLIAMDNQTGGILVIAGGRNRRESELDHAMDTARPPGSAIKPFLYELAYEQGMSPDQLVDNGPLHFGELGFGDPSYDPKNASNNGAGQLPLKEGLIKSENLMTLRIGARVGIGRFIERLRSLGISTNTPIPATPSSFLGSFDVRPIDLVAAYTAFGNGGKRCPPPHIISFIHERTGQQQCLFSWADSSRQCVTLDSVASGIVASNLNEVLERGTARSARSLGLAVPAIGKTGTTNLSKDAWFIGSTQGITCGCWIGFDKPQSVAPATAAVLALPCWVNAIIARGVNHHAFPTQATSKLMLH